jgi:hypothetical protein
VRRQRDRIRDFLIAAVFEKTTKEYEHGNYDGKKRRWYIVPFSEAVHARGGGQHEPLECLRKLDSNAGTLYDYKERRNEIVHEIATQMGRMESERLNDVSRLSSRQKSRLSEQERESIVAAHKDRVLSELQMPMQWYRLLVRASSDAFEYVLRTRAGS